MPKTVKPSKKRVSNVVTIRLTDSQLGAVQDSKDSNESMGDAIRSIVDDWRERHYHATTVFKESHFNDKIPVYLKQIMAFIIAARMSGTYELGCKVFSSNQCSSCRHPINDYIHWCNKQVFIEAKRPDDDVDGHIYVSYYDHYWKK